MPICGIYKITNKVNGKCYIGQSINIKRRWRQHKETYVNPASENYDYPLYKAIRFYGLENFSFEVLEECQPEKLNEKEIYCSPKYSAKGQESAGKPPREELKEMIRGTPFLTLGKQFAVSDNTIRKWCKSYNLPFRRRDINSISDEDWVNI